MSKNIPVNFEVKKLKKSNNKNLNIDNLISSMNELNFNTLDSSFNKSNYINNLGFDVKKIKPDINYNFINDNINNNLSYDYYNDNFKFINNMNRISDNNFLNSSFIPVDVKKVYPSNYINNPFNNILIVDRIEKKNEQCNKSILELSNEKEYLYVINKSKITGFNNILKYIIKDDNLIKDFLSNYKSGIPITYEKYDDINICESKTFNVFSVEKMPSSSFEIYSSLVVSYFYNIYKMMNKKIIFYNLNDEAKKITPRLLLGKELSNNDIIKIYVKSNLEYFIIDDNKLIF